MTGVWIFSSIELLSNYCLQSRGIHARAAVCDSTTGEIAGIHNCGADYADTGNRRECCCVQCDECGAAESDGHSPSRWFGGVAREVHGDGRPAEYWDFGTRFEDS